jgi:hypothetical protein
MFAAEFGEMIVSVLSLQWQRVDVDVRVHRGRAPRVNPSQWGLCDATIFGGATRAAGEGRRLRSHYVCTEHFAADDRAESVPSWPRNTSSRGAV